MFSVISYVLKSFAFLVKSKTKQNKTKQKNTKMFLDEFQDFRHSLGHSKGEVIVMADFKFISTTSTAVEVTSLLNNCCLQQLINQPTHRCGPSLDWAMVSDDSVIIDSGDVIDTALSDHRTVLCSLSLRKPSRAKQQVKS